VYLTFDIGTTSVKVVLYARDGALLAKSIRGYSLATPAVNWYEADPDAYWAAVVDGTRQILSTTAVDPGEIRSISGCSQGETVIFLAEDGRPTRPALVWLDLRARAESEELSTLASRDELYRMTGQTDFDPTWTAAKVLWVKRHEPEVFRRTTRLLLVEDYITWRLTGRACSTANLLSSSLFADVHHRRYWERFVDFLGIAQLLPEIIEPGDLVGTLAPAAAAALGLDPRTIVVKGAMDQATSAIGAGNLFPGIITETTGSVMGIGVTSSRFDPDPAVRLPYLPHVQPGSILYMPYVQTAGSAYKWWRDMFCQEEVRAAGDAEKAYDLMNSLAAAVPPGAEGVVFLPFLAGAGQPENDPDARGVFYGLTLKHGRGHCGRAIMESIAFLLKKILADFARSGVAMREVRAMGGGARSDLWLQIKADVIGLPIARMAEEETSTLGAAILAAVRCGDYPDIAAAAAGMVKLGRRFEPDPRAAAVYERSYALYNALYGALAPVFHTYAHPAHSNG
jgi:xylulokinase